MCLIVTLVLYIIRIEKINIGEDTIVERIYEISEKPLVGIIMGSKSDLETMQETMAILDEL